MMLSTDRLGLRPLVSTDEEVLHGMFTDPMAMRHWPSVFTPAQTAAWLAARISEFHSVGFGVLACVSDEQMIGYCGLRSLNNIRGKQETELVYGLSRRCWGKGFATEASTAVRDYAFSQLRLDRVVALIPPENEPSVRVALRLGMRRETGLMWEDLFHDLYAIAGAELAK